jgi:hypothetical protein
MITNNALERKQSWHDLKIPSLHFPGRTEENDDNILCDSRSCDRNSKSHHKVQAINTNDWINLFVSLIFFVTVSVDLSLSWECESRSNVTFFFSFTEYAYSLPCSQALDNRGSKFLQILGTHVPNYMTSHPRKTQTEHSALWCLCFVCDQNITRLLSTVQWLLLSRANKDHI